MMRALRPALVRVSAINVCIAELSRMTRVASMLFGSREGQALSDVAVATARSVTSAAQSIIMIASY